jgi:hypothetical protein
MAYIPLLAGNDVKSCRLVPGLLTWLVKACQLFRLPLPRSFAALIRGQFQRRKEHNSGRRGCQALLQCE